LEKDHYTLDPYGTVISIVISEGNKGNNLHYNPNERVISKT